MTSIFYPNTYAALENARNFADSLIDPKSEGNRSPTVHHQHDHFHWGSSWGNYQPIFYGGPYQERSRSKKQNYAWIAIPLSIVVAVAIYCIGKNHAEVSQANHGIAKLRDRKIKVQQETSRYPVLANSMQSVIQKQKDILKSIRDTAATNLCIKAIFTASVSTLGVGAFALTNNSSSLFATPLFQVGAIGTALTSAAMLYRAGFSSQDAILKEEAIELKGNIQHATHLLKG